MSKRNYSPIPQEEPEYCVAAVIQMILQRRGLYVQKSQKDILSYFNSVTVDGIEDKTFTNITDMTKQYFEPRNYPLQEKFISWSYVRMYDDNLDDMIHDFLHRDTDIIIYANYTLLTTSPIVISETIGYDSTKLLHKHCFLVDEIIDRNNIYLICPDTIENGGVSRIKVSTNDIYSAWHLQKDKGGLGYSVIYSILKR